EETREYILRGDHPLDFKNLKFTRSVEESVALNHDQNPKIIISSSGMCEAGRIKHHLKHNLWNPKSSIVFVGYQAEGTLGRSIVKGDKRVTIFGEKIQVEAEIYNLEGFSGHADRDGLLEWVSGFQKKPGRIFLVHGEEEAKKAFAKTVKDALDIDCTVVRGNTEYTLSKDKVISAEEALDERISPEALRQIKSRISSIHDDLERILYHTHLAMGSDLSPQQIIEIGNIVMELEKHTLNLGSVVARKTG
ncbi:MAG TPA: MBL fold metallo-hydrolase RNA specificity domain-containing protein, partial [Thermoclostridium caenicola]|nr:MBL fold metallo-hydrolase RNA specificity domain-containing protein [Thermoclostridium caenicola]